MSDYLRSRRYKLSRLLSSLTRVRCRAAAKMTKCQVGCGSIVNAY